MKRITCIEIYGCSDEWKQQLFEKVKDDIPKEFQKRYIYKGYGPLEIPLEQDSTSYVNAMESAKKEGTHPSVRQITYYSKEELEKVEYFEMYIRHPLQSEGTDAADYGTLYEGGCSNPKCRLGKKRIGDVLVDRRFMKKDNKADIGTLRPDIFVSEVLKNLIIENGLTGTSFEHKVRDWKNRDMPNFHVMDIHNVLPPMDSSVWLVPEKTFLPYVVCGHSRIYLNSDVQYKREDLNDALDFNLSEEYIDSYRMQAIIVSAKVRRLFQQYKIRVGYFPVAII